MAGEAMTCECAGTLIHISVSPSWAQPKCFCTCHDPPEYPDLEEYRFASWEHAEAHGEAGSDAEECEGDCAYWPSWWGDLDELEDR
jgi:hypothetical protein